MGESQHGPAVIGTTRNAGDTIAVHFLEEGGQQPAEVAVWIATFIAGAHETLNLAVYDCRLSAEPAGILREALHDRLRAGVRIRLVYDSGDKPQSGAGMDAMGAEPAERDTHERVKEFALPDECLRAVHGERALMHHKYLIRDQQAVWTGSLNFSDDSFARMENIAVALASPKLAGHFDRDFSQLWLTREIANSGAFPTEPDRLRFDGDPAPTDVDFAPGQGHQINEWVAEKLSHARRRIVLCSMLINSSKVLSALLTQLDRGDVKVSGVYDHTQMAGVLDQWREIPDLAWKIEAVERVVREGRLAGKHSRPYRPGQSHNFMHNKTVVVDDTVITGSFNLSHNARENAENMLAIESPALAAEVVAYTSRLASRFVEEPSTSPAGENG
ncbi:MAG: phospholipase D-like domain-containing protein [Thermomicrobiales bacterium]